VSPGAATIVIVDDVAELRVLVKTRLRVSGALRVVGEGTDGTDAVALAKEHRPHLMLLDVSMPGMDGLEALPEVLAISPSTRVVLYSGFEEQGLVDKARQLGAAAFIEKSVPVDTLVSRLLAVLAADSEPRDADVADEGAPESGVSAPRGDQAVLDEHLERFREVFEEAAIGMATMTLTGHIVRANRALAALLQRSTDDLVGTFYGDLTEDGEGAVRSALEDIHRGPVDVVHLEHGVTGATAGRWVRTTLAPVRDSEGRPLYLFLQVQDVSVERAAVDELRKSEQRFRLLVEAVQDYAIFMLTPEGVVASWNAGAERSSGYTAQEIIGRHFRVFYPPEQQRARHPEHELETALREGQYEEEGWRVRKDGTTFWANVLITAVFDDTDRHVGFAKVTRDITERREAEEVLRQSEERFRLVVETVQDYAIFMLDPTGHIVSWNSGAERTKGYTAQEIIGRHFRVFYPPEVQATKHPEHELELALRDGHYEEEGWRVRKDGTTFWANVLITAVHNAVGEHIGFSKVTRDMTERRRLEQEREHTARALATANAELESLNEQLHRAADDQSEFLAVTAHELRTPIGVLGGSAETLQQHWADLTDEERTELFEGMATSTSRLRRLLADLLTASRLQSSALEITPEPVPLVDLVTDAAAASRRTRPDAEIVVDVPPGLAVTADRGRLAQGLDNLIGNALRHGVPPVHVTAEGSVDTVELRVSDHGPGVAAPMQPRLFDRFATGRSRSGTGLGLFIVRELARAQGGDAFYEPASPGRPAGAFVISLPRAPSG
jgi:PAS domain S-box-containing protein